MVVVVVRMVSHGRWAYQYAYIVVLVRQRRYMTMPLPGSGRTALAEPLTPLTSSRRYAAAAGEMAGLDSGTAAELDRDGPVIGRRPK